MEFVRPEYKTIYNKIINNNKLISYLIEIGALITTDDYYEMFGLKSKKDPELYIKEYNENVFKNLASVIFDNREKIENNTITYLSTNKELIDEIKVTLGFDSDDELDTKIYREVFYLYKNTYADNFFQNNWQRFIPDYDFENLDDNEAAKAFVDAMAIEFDKLDEMISKGYEFKSFEEIPDEYINHLSQLLGLEQKDFYIPQEQIEEYRVLAANILEVYKKKGVLSTFDLMFKFFGYRVILTQYYFDRRYYFNTDDENLETVTNNKNSYKFYLTETNPTKNYAENFPISEVVTENDMTEALNLEQFDELVSEYGVECVLGYADYYTPSTNQWSNGKFISNEIDYKYEKDVYSFFKTNLVKITPKPFGKYANYTKSQILILRKIIDFLTPYFWKKQLVIIPDLNDAERLTVNGHRGVHIDGDGNTVNDEGFRLLDSETWIVNDEVAGPTEEEQKRLDQVKNDLVLKTRENDEDSDYVILRDNTVVLTPKQYQQLSKNKKKYKALYTYTDSKVVYAKVANSMDEVNYNNNYYNSVYVADSTFMNTNESGSSYDYNGEEKGFREYSPTGGKTTYEVVVEQIGKKIININSTKGWGKIKDINDTGVLPVYPIWTMDYIPTREGNITKSSYFFPSLIGENHLYIPKHNDYDINKEWSNVELIDLFGLEGDSLKKRFLKSNEEKEIRWVLPQEKTLSEFLQEPENLRDITDFTLSEGKISFNKKNLFETETKKIPNFTWKQMTVDGKAIIVKKDKTEIIEKEKELWSIANQYKLATKSIYKLEDEEINKIRNFDDWKNFRDILKECKKIHNYSVLSEFVKKHNVVNYDYINQDIIDVNISELKFVKDENNVYKLNNSLLAGVTNIENSYLLKFDKSVNGFIVFKLTVEDNSRYNRYYFKKLKPSKVLDRLIESIDIDDSIENRGAQKRRKAISYYFIDDVSELSYADDETEFNKDKRLLFKDGKTYFKNIITNKNGTTSEQEIEVTPTTIIEIDNTESEQCGDRYIATMTTTTFRKPYGLKSDYSLTAKEQNRETELEAVKSTDEKSVGGFYYDENERAIYQNIYKNIKAGDYIYSPKENKIYQFTSNYFDFFSPEDKTVYSSYDYFEYTKEQEQVMYNGFKKDDPDTEEDERIIKYRFKNESGVEEETDGWPMSFTLKDKAYELLEEDNKPELSIFGIKEVELFGNIVYENKTINRDGETYSSKIYKIKTYENNYQGIGEMDDADNYILNNYDRVASWDVLNGCDTRYLEDGIIARPTRFETDKVFEEALKSKEHVEEKDNDKQIVANILQELIGSTRFFGQNNIVRLGVNK